MSIAPSFREFIKESVSKHCVVFWALSHIEYIMYVA
jgi:hypothetical protein